MMRLFGGFPARFWARYEALAPLPEPVAQALPAYQLLYVLVHVVMFGAGWSSHVDALLRRP